MPGTTSTAEEIRFRCPFCNYPDWLNWTRWQLHMRRGHGMSFQETEELFTILMRKRPRK